MKKWFIGVLILFFLFLACIYILIPGKLSVTKIVVMQCSTNGIQRYLSDPGKWKLWWPSQHNNLAPQSNYDSFFTNKKYAYKLTEKLYNSNEISIKYGEDRPVNSMINLIPLLADSVALEWKYEISTSLNPLRRIKEYNNAVKLKSNMAEILESLKSFLEKTENVYGISIKRISTTDTLLVATKSVFNTYPTTSNIYSLINQLRNYIKDEDAKITGFPIMNVQQIDTMKFKLMVAIPVNKVLNKKGDIFFMRMIPGAFMSTEVKGGAYTVNHAFNQLQMYMTDYKKTFMAIPFNALITDRVLEPDTSKWITRLYQPVF